MAVYVELDIYSGRVNLAWELNAAEIAQLRTMLLANPALQVPADADAGGLGYRGYVVTSTGDELISAGLQPQFRVGGQVAYTARQVAQL